MPIRIITVSSKGITVTAQTPSFTARPIDNAGVHIIADGFGYSTAADFEFARVDPVLFDTFSFSESIDFSWVYSKGYADNFVITDSAAVLTSKGVSDTSIISDVATRNFNKSLDETVGFLDELTISRVMFLTFEDVVVFSEDFNNTGELQNWISFSEIQSLIYGKTVEDTATISEVSVVAFTKPSEDGFSISDAPAVGFSRPVEENFSVTDAGALSLQNYFASDYVKGSGDTPYVSNFQTSI